ncbi:hypothetical protein [Solibacillus sp. FSL H8-0538]|uniref:hypothetical protein n=1 Tax=Solibacillus sp. FSL H8-0538 TaxID=2921400 RepID=UPI0030FCF537
MAAEQRLSQVLTKKLGYYVPISEIGYETIWFEKDEVDETIVLPHVIEQLADPYKVWLVNDEVVSNFTEGVELAS